MIYIGSSTPHIWSPICVWGFHLCNRVVFEMCFCYLCVRVCRRVSHFDCQAIGQLQLRQKCFDGCFNSKIICISILKLYCYFKMMCVHACMSSFVCVCMCSVCACMCALCTCMCIVCVHALCMYAQCVGMHACTVYVWMCTLCVSACMHILCVYVWINVSIMLENLDWPA